MAASSLLRLVLALLVAVGASGWQLAAPTAGSSRRASVCMGLKRDRQARQETSKGLMSKIAAPADPFGGGGGLFPESGPAPPTNLEAYRRPSGGKGNPSVPASTVGKKEAAKAASDDAAVQDDDAADE